MKGPLYRLSQEMFGGRNTGPHKVCGRLRVHVLFSYVFFAKFHFLSFPGVVNVDILSPHPQKKPTIHDFFARSFAF